MSSKIYIKEEEDKDANIGEKRVATTGSASSSIRLPPLSESGVSTTPPQTDSNALSTLTLPLKNVESPSSSLRRLPSFRKNQIFQSSSQQDQKVKVSGKCNAGIKSLMNRTDVLDLHGLIWFVSSLCIHTTRLLCCCAIVL
jgi:hypothetical protein